ncbi:MAG: WD repeat-containing protein 76 [Paramarteilia canceri]
MDENGVSDPNNDVEKRRLDNLHDNARILSELGIKNFDLSIIQPPAKKPLISKLPKQRSKPSKANLSNITKPRLRSSFKSENGSKLEPISYTDIENREQVEVERAPEGDFDLKNVDIIEWLPPKLVEYPEILADNEFKSLKSLSSDATKLFKVIDSRITDLTCHPSQENLVIFSADRNGFFSMFKSTFEPNNYDLESYELSSFKLHDTSINSVSVDPFDFSRLFTSSFDNAVRVFEFSQSQNRVVFEYKDQNTKNRLSFSCPGSSKDIIHFGTSGGFYGLKDLRAEEKNIEIQVEKKRVYSVSQKPQDENILAIAVGQSCQIIDLRAAASIETVLTSSRNITSAQFSPKSGKHLSIAGYSSFVATYSTNEGVYTKLERINHNNNTGRWLSKFRTVWAPNSDEYFNIGSLEQPRRIDLFNSKCELVANLGLGQLTYVCSVISFHPNAKYMIGGNSSGKIQIFTSN